MTLRRRSRRSMRSVLAASVAIASCASNALGCGYAPLHASQGPSRFRERYAVVLASSDVPDVVTTDEVLAGVREELAKAEALETGADYPRCGIEVLRVDESAEGISATPNRTGRLMPDSRATRLGVVARAWVVRNATDEHHGDTGDVRAFETTSVASSSRAATFQYDDGLRSAARRVGHKLGARILGIPAASED